MSGRSPNIFLGDFARALRELRATEPSTVELVAEMLGLRIEEAAGPTPEPPREEAVAPTQAGTEAAAPPRPKPEGEEVKGPQVEPRVVPVELSSSRDRGREWMPSVKAFPPQEETVDVTPPPLRPLFTPHWTRGILGASLATEDEYGTLDVERVTETLASCEPVEHLPTVASKTMRRGAQLLLDVSLAMMPFERDQLWLTRAIRRVVGESHVEVLSFAGSPLRGAGDGLDPFPEYNPPLPGTPVVLLTDLGILRAPRAADRAGEAEWREFCEVVRRAGCPLTAFVPYKSTRWPPSLKGRMTIIRWDRSTTAATVSRILKLSRRCDGREG